MRLCSGGNQRFVQAHRFDEEIVEYCARNGVVSIPGSFTPSEVQRAIKAATKGTRSLDPETEKNMKDLPLVVKIFPDVRFLPFGGINIGNLVEYLKAGAWAVGGTWICKRELIQTGNFAKITEFVKEAMNTIAKYRR